MNAEAVAQAIRSVLEAAGPDDSAERSAARATLVSLLREQPDLAIFDDRLVPREMMARRYTLWELARWLILRAEATSAERAASDLLAHIAETTCLVRQVCLVEGQNRSRTRGTLRGSFEKAIAGRTYQARESKAELEEARAWFAERAEEEGAEDGCGNNPVGGLPGTR